MEKLTEGDCESLQSDTKQDDLDDEKFDEMLKFTKNDFLGFLKGKTFEEKKAEIINLYRYFFRFSFEKVNEFIDRPIMKVMILEYLRQTQMKRVHQRKTLCKNVNAYYRAMENIINISQLKEISF